jgi:ribosome biogenesis GTPase / thiamine phosphate phosphatase
LLSLTLPDLGYRPFFSAQIDRLQRPDLVPGRIAADGPGIYHLLGCQAPLGELSGRLRHALSGSNRPAVGDWVAVADDPERAIVHHVLERQTAMVRRAADSDSMAQVIAANLDVIFVVTSANRDLNLRRLERYLTAVWDSGAAPAIVLNKIDLVPDVAPLVAEIEGVAFGVPILPVSASLDLGMEGVRERVGPGITAALVGSSGVGKSSLVNRLLGREAQFVNAIREDDARGRHTTTRRELLLLPGGGVLIDTPGMRELGLLEDDGGVAATFADIEEMALSCRFHDCRHEGEPGCAVRESLAAGTLDRGRWESYRKLRKEIAAAETRRDPVLAAEERRRWKVIHKSMRSHPKLSRQG